MTVYKTFTEKAAYFIAAVTHPLFVPFWGFLVFNNYNVQFLHGSYFWLILGVFGISSIALPIYFVYSLKRSGHLKSYDMLTLRERRCPLLFTAGLLCFNFFLMQRAQLSQPYQVYFLFSAISALFASLVSMFYKISLHMLGAGFMFGLGFALSRVSADDIRFYMILVGLFSGIIAWTRIYLKAHTLTQVYLGFISGSCCAAAMLYLL